MTRRTFPASRARPASPASPASPKVRRTSAARRWALQGLWSVAMPSAPPTNEDPKGRRPPQRRRLPSGQVPRTPPMPCQWGGSEGAPLSWAAMTGTATPPGPWIGTRGASRAGLTSPRRSLIPGGCLLALPLSPPLRICACVFVCVCLYVCRASARVSICPTSLLTHPLCVTCRVLPHS